MNTIFFDSFVVLAEEKNISRAAARLFISRSALNRQLLAVESELGEPLFKRLGNSLELTYLGKVYWDMAVKVLDIVNRSELMMTSISNSIHGKITFGASPTFCPAVLTAVFPRFHEKYPGITIEAVQGDSTYLANLLRSGELDIAVISSNDVTEDISSTFLQDGEVVLVAPDTHKMASRAGIDGRGELLQCDLNWFRDDLFCMQARTSPMFDIIQDAFRVADFTPNIILENTTRSLSLALTSDGIANAFLIDIFLDSVPGIVKFALCPRAYYSLSLATIKNYSPSSAEQYFLDLVESFLKDTH